MSRIDRSNFSAAVGMRAPLEGVSETKGREKLQTGSAPSFFKGLFF